MFAGLQNKLIGSVLRLINSYAFGPYNCTHEIGIKRLYYKLENFS